MCCEYCSGKSESVVIIVDMADKKILLASRPELNAYVFIFLKDVRVALNGWIPEEIITTERTVTHVEWDAVSPIISKRKSQGSRVKCLAS